MWQGTESNKDCELEFVESVTSAGEMLSICIILAQFSHNQLLKLASESHSGAGLSYNWWGISLVYSIQGLGPSGQPWWDVNRKRV